MSDPTAMVSISAGELLRQAREANGMTLDHLASLLKVPEARLKALEAGDLSDMPGVAFARGLASSVCRQLDIDVQPVLDAMPSLRQPSAELEHVTRGLETPFQAGGGRYLPGLPASLPDWIRPGVLAPFVLVLLALGFWFAPNLRPWKATLSGPVSATEAASAAEFSVSTVGLASGALAASAAVPAPTSVTTEVVSPNVSPLTPAASAPAPLTGLSPVAAALAASKNIPVAPSPAAEAASGQMPGALAPAAGVAAASASGVMVIKPGKDAWIEVRDSRSVLVSRMVPANEVLSLDGQAPFKVKIGNARDVQMTYQGHPVDLVPATKGSVARLELK